MCLGAGGGLGTTLKLSDAVPLSRTTKYPRQSIASFLDLPPKHHDERRSRPVPKHVSLSIVAKFHVVVVKVCHLFYFNNSITIP